METFRSSIIRRGSTATSSPTRARTRLVSLRYEDCTALQPPIPIIVAPPRAPLDAIHPALRARGSTMVDGDESKRDSGLATSMSSKAREESVAADGDSVSSFLGVVINFDPPPQTSSTDLSQASAKAPTTITMSRSESAGAGGSGNLGKPSINPSATSPSTSTDTPFSITTSIPNESLLEEDFLEHLSFSKRGSMMLGGKKAVKGHEHINSSRRCAVPI